MKIRNINSSFGDTSIIFASVEEMLDALHDCGPGWESLTEDDLVEGRDYEVIDEIANNTEIGETT